MTALSLRFPHRGVATGGGGGGGAAVAYDTSMGVSVDANGFTSLPLRAGATRYYVKNGGSDSNAGTNPTAPLATVAHAVSLVTSGNGDQVLLAEGSTFSEFLPLLKSGFSAAYPMVLASYDPADPTNDAKVGMGHQRSARPILTGGYGQIAGSGSPLTYIAIKGLDLNPGNTPGNQLSMIGNGTVGPASYVLLENNLCRYGGISFTDGGDGLHTPLSHKIIIRNNSIYGTYTTNTSHTGGIYIDGNDDITIEDNVIWHTGWKIGASRDDPDTSGGPTVFNHPMYLQANSVIQTVRRNLMMDNAADGGIARGTTILWQQNVAIKSPSGFGFGPGNFVDWSAQPNGTTVDASYNLSVGAVDLNSGAPRGMGYTTANLTPGSRIHHNLLIYSATAFPGNADQAIQTTGANGYDPSLASHLTYTEFEFNTAFHWSALNHAAFETSFPNRTFYSDNIWDGTTSGLNTNSASASFPNAYTEAALYSASGVTDYNTLTTLASNYPENHYQRTLLATAFAGYGMATSQTDTTAPTLSSPTATGGTNTVTLGVTTDDGTGRLYYDLLTTATPPHPSQVKFGLDASGNYSVGVGHLDISSSGTKSISPTHITAGTYHAHLVHEDSAGNKSTVAVTPSFTVTGLTYATLSTTDHSAGITLANNLNLSVQSSTSAGPFGIRANQALPTGAKTYWEAHVDAFNDACQFGLADAAAGLTGTWWGVTANAHAVGWYGATLRYNTTTQAVRSPSGYVGFAYDDTAKKLWVRDSVGWINGDPAAGTGGLSVSGIGSPVYAAWQGDGADGATFNFGNAAYQYTPPTGFLDYGV
jgi:hypothetical protein